MNGSRNKMSRDIRKLSKYHEKIFYAFYLVLFIIAFVSLFSSCTSTIQVVQPSPNVKLRQYTRIFLYSPYLPSTEAVKGVGTKLGPGFIGGTQAVSGVDAVVQALNSLKFELTSIGFRIVEKPIDAELVGELSIDGLHYNPLVGWVANQAILVIKDNAGNTLFVFRAKPSGMIASPIDSLISEIAKAIRQRY
jgi:hypothetical protein